MSRVIFQVNERKTRKSVTIGSERTERMEMYRDLRETYSSWHWMMPLMLRVIRSMIFFLIKYLDRTKAHRKLAEHTHTLASIWTVTRGRIIKCYIMYIV